MDPRPLAGEMPWLWRGYLAPGQLILLTSLWKSGKTTPGDRRRLLLARSRHEETPRRLLIEGSADGADYRVLADPPEEDFERGWSAIGLVLSAREAPQTSADILRTWPATSPPPSRATLHRWLARAVERQRVRCGPTKRRNAPYRYRLAEGEEG
jgi:hypothetical protein